MNLVELTGVSSDPLELVEEIFEELMGFDDDGRRRGFFFFLNLTWSPHAALRPWHNHRDF